METNVVKNTELGNYNSVARRLKDNSNEDVDAEEEIYFYDLTIPVDYGDLDILEEEKETISKNDEVWFKTKNGYGD